MKAKDRINLGSFKRGVHIKKYSLLLLFGLAIMFWDLPNVNLNFPQGGETFQSGDLINIQWNNASGGNPINYDLYFSSDGGYTWEAIALNIDPSFSNHHWIVHELETSEGRIRVVQDNEGIDYEGTSGNFTILASVNIDDKYRESDAKVQPNPMEDYTIIEFDNNKHEIFSLIIYNLNGQVVKEVENIVSEKYILNKDQLESGLYFYQLYNSDRIRSSGKLIVK